MFQNFSFTVEFYIHGQEAQYPHHEAVLTSEQKAVNHPLNNVSVTGLDDCQGPGEFCNITLDNENKTRLHSVNGGWVKDKGGAKNGVSAHKNGVSAHKQPDQIQQEICSDSKGLTLPVIWA